MAKAKDKELVKRESQLPVVHDYGEDTGAGYEHTTSDDFAVPFLNILQALSPQVSGENPLEGAKPGGLINSVSSELYDSKKGIIFVPCDTQHVFVEWRPRGEGGGFIAIHAVDSDMVKACKAAAGNTFGDLHTEEGNDLEETFYMYGLILDKPDALEPKELIVLAFSSTKIKVYKRLMYKLRTVKGRPPLFAHRVLITTVTEKNNKGTYYNYAVAPAVEDNVLRSLIPPLYEGEPHPILACAKDFRDQVRSGLATINPDQQSGAGGNAAEDEVF